MLQSKESVNTVRMLYLSICTWSVRRGFFRKAKTTRPFCYMAPKHRGQLNTTALTQLFSMRWVSDSSISNQSRTNYPNMIDSNTFKKGCFSLGKWTWLQWQIKSFEVKLPSSATRLRLDLHKLGSREEQKIDSPQSNNVKCANGCRYINV